MAEDQKTYLLEKLTKRKRMQHNKNYLLFFMEFHKKTEDNSERGKIFLTYF
jgi:hypothetical protein